MGTRGSARPKKYLYLTVHEASGLLRDKEVLWEPTFTDGFVRVEVKGEGKVSKANTLNQRVEDCTITWEQELRLEVSDTSQELRIMLCKERVRSESDRKSAQVIAACGIFVSDILEAVPIDKYFELFKPVADSSCGLGGFVRIAMRASSTRKPLAETQGNGDESLNQENVRLSRDVAAQIQERLSGYNQQPQDPEAGGKGRHIIPLICVGAAAAVLTTFKVVASWK
ncbi:hypothetical protein BSKO_08835 [Bryopsis sp. KO-2023]|nr:hypothetical protein BSKO_08835 [Bryopsis sp. KO-2023]